MKYKVTCTLQYAFPEGRYTGFRRTKVEHGLERTEPKRTVMYTVTARNEKSAIADAKDKVRQMKEAYESDGWCCYVNGHDLTFVSDKTVYNIYSDWKVEE